MYTLYHAPFSCSLASKLALIEAGLPHEIIVINTARGENLDASFRQVNPRGKVPALATEDGVLTESTAILPYIADQAAERRLLPAPGTFARARAQSWLSFLSSTLHTAFALTLFPERYVADNSHASAVESAALEQLTSALADLDKQLADRDYILGDFSMCDLYALVFCLWRGAPKLAGRLPEFSDLNAFQARLLGRPGIMPVISEDLTARAAATR